MTTNSFPLHVFRFNVEFKSAAALGGASADATVYETAFAECSGLEMTMEPKAIKEGGRNYGVAQRAGQISGSTVVLKRGISRNQDLWAIFNSISSGLYAARLQVTIKVNEVNGRPATTTAAIIWELDRAMPIKFKFADLNAKGTEVGIEELHLVHEGLTLTSANGGQ